MEIENRVLPPDVKGPRAENGRESAQDPGGDVNRTEAIRILHKRSGGQEKLLEEQQLPTSWSSVKPKHAQRRGCPGFGFPRVSGTK
jgi:hypothetical protein